MPLAERLERRSIPEPNTGCLLWIGTWTHHGYGQIWAARNSKRMISTHRAAYELTYGKIPDGMCVLHKCDVRCCINPDHLFLGTDADNVADMIAKGRRKGLMSKGIKWRKREAQRIAFLAQLDTTGTS